MTDNKISVNLATLESNIHETNAVERAVKIYEVGTAKVCKHEGRFWFLAEDSGGSRKGTVEFMKDRI